MTDAVTVVICAHTEERWRDMQEAVASLRRQTVPPARIVLVIDNNAALFARASLEFADIMVLENASARGLSGGRNTGLAHAPHPFVAFLDDDAVAGERFLETLLEECRRPDVLGASARVEPIWLDEPPRWLPQSFYWTIGCTYFEPGEARREVRNVSGGAALYKRDVFTRIGGFSSALGRDGSRLPLSCEETELCIRAGRAFPRGRFIHRDDVSVGHKVSGARLSFGYFVRRCFAEGISKYRLTLLHRRPETLRTERRYAFAVMRNVLFGSTRPSSSRWQRTVSAAAAVLGLAAAGTGYLTQSMIRRPYSGRVPREGPKRADLTERAPPEAMNPPRL